MIKLATRLLRRLQREPIRITIGLEPYGPFLPWQETLARSVAKVPAPQRAEEKTAEPAT